MMTALKHLFGSDPRQFGMIFALLALVSFFQIQTGGLVLTPANLMNLLNGNAYILVLAVGMVLVIIAGHIDLSVGSVAAFAGIVLALAIRDWGLAPWLAVLLCLGVGALIGAWQGFWVAYVGIPAFVVTLAGMMLFRGANQALGHANTIPVPESIQFLGGGYLPTFGYDTGLNDPTLMLGTGAILWLVIGGWRARQRTLALGGEVAPLGILAARLGLLAVVIAWLTYQFASGRPGTSFPVPGLMLVSLVLLYSFIAGHTILGRHVYAVGGNSQAARLSGVDTRRVTFLVMMNMSILAALAGLMFVGRATASGPFDGVSWELDAISAVFIGGAAVSGGVGTVIGAVIGGLVMAVLNNGLQLMGVGADWTQIIKGLVLLLAVAFDVYSKRQGRPSIIGWLMRQRPQPHPRSAQTEAATPAVLPVVLAALLLVGLGAGLLWLTGHRPTPGADADSAASGFPADSLIGVALPQKTSENWVLAQQLFQHGLGAAGFRFDVQFANGGVPEQQNQIQTMVAKGAKVIIVGAIDGSQLGGQLREAEDAGTRVIAYDRLLTNTSAVDYYVAYDNFKVGVLQGQALLEGLAQRKGAPPWTIELFAGSPDDANSQVFFDGAMSVLGPRIQDGTLVVTSRQTRFAQAATQGWKAENAQRRMDTLFAGTYDQTELAGVLAPNDTLARAILTSARAAGKALPVVTGQDSEVESVKSILRGEQYASIYKSTSDLVRQAIAMVVDLQQGREPPVNDDHSYNNGVKIVPAYLLEPLIVTQANAREVYAQDPILKRIVNP
ncbi:Multiple sugar-binding periplasmic receptor ChvE precursor [Thiorhodovibrio winogradskyi]|uniref:Xylose transport system permease protein XylH n=1 Tax=Thiorhodovibrio winogradskyi TaxID=77007 RepID=A0ABZ0SHG6_9GAMM|nr:multiple monosaccharide ABC transporter permease [Thiorhodovibrio winogradskyi]